MLPQSSEHQNELDSLHLKLEWLKEIGLRILAARRQTTSHDAVVAAGSYAYLAGVRFLRDILCPHGWQPLVKNNLELVANGDNSVHLLVSSGDINTGNKSQSPKTKNKKGTQTKRIIDVNLAQLCFWPEDQKNNQKDSDNKVSTWVLLHYFDENKSEMRMELSLPINFDDFNSNVGVWEKRIILPEIKIDDIIVDEYIEEPQEFDFEVRRKKNE